VTIFGAVVATLFALDVTAAAAGNKQDRRPLALLAWVYQEFVVAFLNWVGNGVGTGLASMRQALLSDPVRESAENLMSLVKAITGTPFGMWSAFATSMGWSPDLRAFLTFVCAGLIIGGAVFAVTVVWAQGTAAREMARQQQPPSAAPPVVVRK
jgi:hypothetical protein